MTSTIRQHAEAIARLCPRDECAPYPTLAVHVHAQAILDALNNAGWDVLTLSLYPGVVRCRSIPDPEAE
jgi:hypothetical protein